MDAATAQSLRATVDDAWQILLQDDTNDTNLPTALVREFIVPDFVHAARLTSAVAAAAQLQNHFPRITMDRRIVRKEWQVFVQVQCHTVVLGGLSTHDFHLAMVRACVRAARVVNCLGIDGNGRRDTNDRTKPTIVFSETNAMQLSNFLLLLCLFSTQMIDVEVNRPGVRELWTSPDPV